MNLKTTVKRFEELTSTILLTLLRSLRLLEPFHVVVVRLLVGVHHFLLHRVRPGAHERLWLVEVLEVMLVKRILG